MSRLISNILLLTSLAAIAAVGYYFYDAYDATRVRERALGEIREVAENDGPCAGMLKATEIRRRLGSDIARTVEGIRRTHAADIVGAANRRAQSALLEGLDNGLVDRMLCEQIMLDAAAEVIHPVLALFLITRQDEDPCKEEIPVEEVLRGLGAHRRVLLHGLMKDVADLVCLEPAEAHEVAVRAAELLYEEPRVFDAMDVLRIAGFLHRWAPLQAAQLGCRIEAGGDVSRLGNALGCSADQKRRILTRYRYPFALAEDGDRPGLTAGEEVFLLWRASQQRCEITPRKSTAAIFPVPCRELELLSDVHLAVRIEDIDYKPVRADLIAGLATYDGAKQSISKAEAEAPANSWFAYSRDGKPLGSTAVVDLQTIAEELGAEVPESPLRTFCRNSGAKYCYDVDWAQVVGKVPGEAVVFLSRPIDVFPPVMADDTGARSLFNSAFGRAPKEETAPKIFVLSQAAHLVVEAARDGFALRWRLGLTDTWRAQVFGKGEGGREPPQARLLAVLDLEDDDRPEIIVQRGMRDGEDNDEVGSVDEIFLMRLNKSGARFDMINRLTVHEY